MMEVDNEIDSQLLQQFSSMGTNDREVLIAEFQRLLGDQLNASGCAFYLDMNNWNLQAAICSYYDLEHPAINLPSMSFVKDITIGEGESIPPNTSFVKTWRIKNSGEDAWPPGCCLHFVSGVQFCDRDRVMVSGIQPGAVTDVSVEMVSPGLTGLHQGQWRMCTATGSFFGEFIWVIVQVEENGLMGVTQQLSQFGGDLSHPVCQQAAQNPFASPVKDPGPQPGFVTSAQNNGVFDAGPMMGSPMGSDVAQHGSFPNSPCVPGITAGQGSGPHDPTRPSEHVRTALFQQGAETPQLGSHDVILPSGNVQQHTTLQPNESSEQNYHNDMIDMS